MADIIVFSQISVPASYTSPATASPEGSSSGASPQQIAEFLTHVHNSPDNYSQPNRRSSDATLPSSNTALVSSPAGHVIEPVSPYYISLNDYLRTHEIQTPEQALEALSKSIELACHSPHEAAMFFNTNGVKERRIGQHVAKLVEKGGVQGLCDVYISLIGLLYEDNVIDKQGVIDNFLPQKKHDRNKSLSHVITGWGWPSAATTRLCSLLSSIAKDDAGIRSQIISRLSMKQSGYVFKTHKLPLEADFYKLAKHADHLHENKKAKHLLKESGLIPENRELYNKSYPFDEPIETSDPQRYDLLFKKLKNKIGPEILAKHNKLQQERDASGRYPISIGQTFAQEGANKKTDESKVCNALASFADYDRTQKNLHDLSSQKKDLADERAQRSKFIQNYSKTYSYKNSDAPKSLMNNHWANH